MKFRVHKGFTLIEMLCASGISLLAVLGMVSLFVTHAHSYTNHKLVREMQQNARFAVDSISRELRMAGYGLNIRDRSLPLWIPWITNMTHNPLLTQGATSADPDTLTIAAAFDEPIATLSAGTAAKAVALSLQTGEGIHFDTRKRSVIFIGRLETARITAKNGDQLTISTDPSATGKGLRRAYPVGTPIELVQVISYRCASDMPLFGGERFLIRDTGDPAVADWQKMLSGYMGDFQVAGAGYGTWVSLTAMTADPLATHTPAPNANDGHLRTTITTRIVPRNDTAFGLRQ